MSDTLPPPESAGSFTTLRESGRSEVATFFIGAQSDRKLAHLRTFKGEMFPHREVKNHQVSTGPGRFAGSSLSKRQAMAYRELISAEQAENHPLIQ